MCSAQGNITCGVSPCVKDQIHKCKEMGGKRQTPHGQHGGGWGVPLRRGVLEKACWGGAEGNMESLGLQPSGTEMGINEWVEGPCQWSREESMLGESGDFLASV